MTEAAIRPPTLPFPANTAFASRMASLTSTVGPAVETDLREILDAGPQGPLDGSVVPAEAGASLVARHGLVAIDELALLALPLAAELARPAISGYRVAAVPSAVVLTLAPSGWVGGGCVESVAYNPSIGALQAALVELAAARLDPSSIVDAWLAKLDAGAVDPEPGFRALLYAVAPAANARVVRWRTTG
ncbi:MAG TPA: hypothetical protein VE011_12485 [Candidatus Dormibacteraeota bacterium]|nr:hypothetical protein [Candidatus Dormibacteraeota bacterium]